MPAVALVRLGGLLVVIILALLFNLRGSFVKLNGAFRVQPQIAGISTDITHAIGNRRQSFVITFFQCRQIYFPDAKFAGNFLHTFFALQAAAFQNCADIINVYIQFFRIFHGFNFRNQVAFRY